MTVVLFVAWMPRRSRGSGRQLPPRRDRVFRHPSAALNALEANAPFQIPLELRGEPTLFRPGPAVHPLWGQPDQDAAVARDRRGDGSGRLICHRGTIICSTVAA